MTLVEWQRALRKQIAEEEPMAVDAVDEKNLPGEYEVRNPQTKQVYKVVYRGEESPWNYCSCLDFKTSRLCTCKHIESVKLWIEGNRRWRKVHKEPPAYTSVYLSYTDGRQVKIRVGSDHREEFMELAAHYFDAEGVMFPYAFDDYDKLLVEAANIDPSFRFYQDAIDFILEQRERKFRERLIKSYTDQRLDNLLTVSLYPYQREGIRFAFERGRTIIADEMGLGKTIQAIGTAELLRREGLAEQVLIVCPTSLKYQWQREIERFVVGNASKRCSTELQSLEASPTKPLTLVIEGNPMKRKEQYASDVPYKIVSYNCMSNDVKMWGSLQTEVLIMDEVQRLKNWKTQISMAARKIRSDYAVILSGTPLENKLEELYSVMEFADNYCLGPYWQFRADCIVTDDGGKVIGYQNLNRVGEMARERLIRRTKKQVALQMPKRTDQNLFVPMTKEQMDIHDEYKVSVANLVQKWRKMHFLTEKDRQRLLQFLSMMRMVCDSTYILDQKSRYDTKVTETMSILQSVFENGDEKVVIFSQWERMTRLIAYELDKLGVRYEYLHGGVPSKARRDLISNFTDNPYSRVFLSTDAGSTGLNLQAGSIMINLDLPWNPAVLEQRIARIYRLGQERNVQVINLVAKGTIEEGMLGKLRFKTAMFEGVLDNGEDTIFLGNESKFTAMMDTLGEVFEEEKRVGADDKGDLQSPVSAHTAAPSAPVGASEVPTSSSPARISFVDDDAADEPEPVKETASEVPLTPEVSGISGVPEASGISEVSDASVAQETHSHAPRQPKELVTQGISFLSGLAETLKSPEATAQLVETLVETDAETGQASLRIPVPDKQTVRNLLDIVGKLFG
ncbi:MAG: DEAD/DEAH box helicase [Prevotella sp.]|nr:DEAD/DEAH box helicase [Bacteroidaceae bacterium]MBQ6767295.1 DEAD/DEAH box helicase [Prevotella sp.]MBR0050247.1 DEAD/DEAH box helicase [Prevotella sp.]